MCVCVVCVFSEERIYKRAVSLYPSFTQYPSFLFSINTDPSCSPRIKATFVSVKVPQLARGEVEPEGPVYQVSEVTIFLGPSPGAALSAQSHHYAASKAWRGSASPRLMS